MKISKRENSRSVGDPLLASVHNPELAVLSLHGGSREPSDVRARLRFRDSERNELLRCEHLRDDLSRICSVTSYPPPETMKYLGLQLIRAEVEYRRQTNDHTALQTIREATSTTPCKLLSDDEFVEVVELGTFVSNRTHI